MNVSSHIKRAMSIVFFNYFHFYLAFPKIPVIMGFMAHNRIKPTTLNTAPNLLEQAQQVVCAELMKSMLRVAVDLKLQVSGQAAIEGETIDKLMVVYSCFPNGDSIVWFLSLGCYHVMALVNQKFQHVGRYPVQHPELFQQSLNDLKTKLGK